MPTPLRRGGSPGASGGTGMRNFEILARVARSLLGTLLDAGDHLDLTLKIATKSLGATRGSIMTSDEAAKTLRISVAVGLPPEALEQVTPFGDGIAGWVAENDEPVVVHGDFVDPRFVGVDPSIESSISLPLSVEGKVLGVLNIVRTSGKRFTDDDLKLAAALADLAAIAIEKADLYSALREREARVSALLHAAIQAQEQERRRIAADIHDGFLQDLSALFLKAETARMYLARDHPEEVAQAIDEIKVMVQQEVLELRDYIFEVRPPSLDQIGLAPTLKAMTERFASEHSLTGLFESRVGSQRFPEAIEAILYRTAQEALRNVAKHAGAHQFWVTLDRSGDEVLLDVVDDGSGIETDVSGRRNHFGIETMRERVELAGGRFTIGRGSKGGTEVQAVIPLDTGLT
ncbi:MAG: GAF domain-containing protein [Actinomycetota bacterium]